MRRLSCLLAHQKRFVRDASHQQRTPLAVLKTQVQSALRGDLPPGQALHEIGGTAQRATQLAVRLRTHGAQAVLSIADAGAGIDDELAARLFEPFSAGDVRKGSGLGLAICQEIVQALDGSIVLANRRQGARVLGLDAVVRLPLAPGAGEAKSAP